MQTPKKLKEARKTENVIQFGEGNFLRGFVDYFLFKMKEKGLFNGSVVVVQPIQNGLCDVINEQNGKYNLFLRGVEAGKTVSERSEIDIISRCINPYEDYDAYLSLAHQPEMRFIFSNTTEAGIAFDANDTQNDRPQNSFPAKLTRLLLERFRCGLPGFAIFACELIDNNASELKKCVLKYAEQWQTENDFCKWIETDNIFCNTLVDRIVTGYPADEAQNLCESIGYTDKLLDTAEPFHLWVIEGNLEDELPLVKAGFNVVWTDDVSPYKKRKVRVLNGAHTSMVTGALLMGLETVGDCLRDETVNAFLQKALFKEILPVLGDTQDNRAFAMAALERFSNPFIKHRLRSIVLNSVSKFSVRVLPSLLDYQRKNGTYPPCLTFSLATLIKFYKSDLPQDSPVSCDKLKNSSIEIILADKTLWGEDLTFLCGKVNECLAYIDKHGISEAFKWVLSE